MHLPDNDSLTTLVSVDKWDFSTMLSTRWRKIATGCLSFEPETGGSVSQRRSGRKRDRGLTSDPTLTVYLPHGRNALITADGSQSSDAARAVVDRAWLGGGVVAVTLPCGAAVRHQNV